MRPASRAAVRGAETGRGDRYRGAAGKGPGKVALAAARAGARPEEPDSRVGEQVVDVPPPGPRLELGKAPVAGDAGGDAAARAPDVQVVSGVEKAFCEGPCAYSNGGQQTQMKNVGSPITHRYAALSAWGWTRAAHSDRGGACRFRQPEPGSPQSGARAAAGPSPGCPPCNSSATRPPRIPTLGLL